MVRYSLVMFYVIAPSISELCDTNALFFKAHDVLYVGLKTESTYRYGRDKLIFMAKNRSKLAHLGSVIARKTWYDLYTAGLTKSVPKFISVWTNVNFRG